MQIRVLRLSSPRVITAAGRVRRLTRYDRLRAWVIANRLFALALAAGTVLRLVAVLGYPGALYFAGDSYVYLGAALRLMPDRSKSTGYSVFLKVLEPFHSLTLVTIVQHLMGLAIAVMIYALLRRARVPKLWAALATLPVLLNSFQVELEHMVMADALFMFLLVAAAALLLWRERPSWRAVLLAGLLTGYAITVWVPGVLIAIVFLGFLIVRRMGWRSLAAILAGCAAPAAAYVLWFHSQTGDYGLTDSGGFYLWGRMSSFAECSRINPPADERMLCLSQPPSRREPPGDLIWHEPQVMAALPGGPVSAKGNALMESFAIRAVEAQPLSYVHVIIDGLVLAVEPVHHPYPSAGTLYDYYFHTKPQTVPDRSWIPGATAPQDIRAYGHASISRVVEPFAYAMAAYQRVFWLYGPLFALIMILGLGGFVRVVRRDGWRISIRRRRDRPSMMPWAAAVVLLLGPIATADFDYRYLLPVVPFASLAAGLAFAAPAIRPGRKDPQPSGAEAVPGEETVADASQAVDARLSRQLAKRERKFRTVSRSRTCDLESSQNSRSFCSENPVVAEPLIPDPAESPVARHSCRRPGPLAAVGRVRAERLADVLPDHAVLRAHRHPRPAQGLLTDREETLPHLLRHRRMAAALPQPAVVRAAGQPELPARGLLPDQRVKADCVQPKQLRLLPVQRTQLGHLRPAPARQRRRVRVVLGLRLARPRPQPDRRRGTRSPPPGGGPS